MAATDRFQRRTISVNDMPNQFDFSDLGAKPDAPSSYFSVGATLIKPAVRQDTVEEFENKGGNAATENEFARGVARGGTRAVGSAVDFIRVFSDSPRLKKIADEMASTAEAIPTKADSITSVISNPTLAPAYVARVTGELAPQAVAAYLSGGATSGIARIAGATGRAARLAAGVGAAATSIPQEVGDIARETEDRTGRIDSTNSLIYGIPSGLLDAVSAERILGKVFSVAEDAGRKRAWRQIVRETVKEIPKAAGVEGVTESMQEVLHIFADKAADQTFSLLTKENGLRVLESAVAGAIGGGFLGGGTELASLPMQKAERNRQAADIREKRGLRNRLAEFIRENPTVAAPETPVLPGDSSTTTTDQVVQNNQTPVVVDASVTPPAVTPPAVVAPAPAEPVTPAAAPPVAPLVESAPEPPAKKIAPVTYIGFQETPKGGYNNYNLTEDIPGHKAGSTVSGPTLAKYGYEIPESENKSAPSKQTISDEMKAKVDVMPIVEQAKVYAATKTLERMKFELNLAKELMRSTKAPAPASSMDEKMAFLNAKTKLSLEVQALTEAMQAVTQTTEVANENKNKEASALPDVQSKPAIEPAKVEAPARVEVEKSDAPVTPATVSGSSQFFIPAVNVGTRGKMNPAQDSPTLPGEATFVAPDGSAVPAGTVFQVRYRTSGSGKGLRVYAGDKPIYQIDLPGTASEQDGRKGVAVDSAELMDLSKWKKVPKAPFVLPRDIKQKVAQKETESDETGVVQESMGSKTGDVKPLAESSPSTFSETPAEVMADVVPASNGDPAAHLDALVMFLESNPELIADLKSGVPARKARVDEAVAKWLMDRTMKKAGKRVITSEMRAQLERSASEQAQNDLLELSESGEILSLILNNRWQPDGNVTDTKVATGPEEIRDMLPDAGLNPEQMRIAQFLLDNVPAKYLQQLTMRIRTVLKNNSKRTVADGSFNSMLDIVDIARNSTNPTVMAHEVSHYLSSFLTSGYRVQNFNQWRAAADEFLADHQWLPENIRQGFQDGMTTSEFRQMVMDSADAGFGPDLPKYLINYYNLINPDEFFAKRFTNVINERSQEVGWVSGIIRSIIDAVKRLFGKQSLYEQAWNDLRNGRVPADIRSGMLFEKNNQRRGLIASLSSLSSIEDVDRVATNIAPDPNTIAFYRDTASAVNRSLISPEAEAAFNPLSKEVKEHLNDAIYGPLSTITGDMTFEQMLASDEYTPEQKAHASLIAFENWIKFNTDASKVRSQLEQKRTELADTTIKAISEIPERNEAELLAERLLATVIDKIHADLLMVGNNASTNEKIAAATENLKELQKLARSTPALRNSLVGMARLIPPNVLRKPADGAQVLEELSSAIGMSVSGITNHTQWIKRLASELHKFEVDDKRVVNAGADVIAASLQMLYQIGNANQALLMITMSEDGTVKKFDKDMLDDLASKSPVGYTALLKKYAKSQVESDALQRASKSINRKVDRLTDQVSQLEQATTVLDTLQKSPDHIAHGKSVQAANDAQYLDYETVDLKEGGHIMRYKDPVTGKSVDIQNGLNGEVEIENINKLAELAQHGFEYAASAGADPFRAAYWNEFGNRIINTYLRPDLNPASSFKVPAFLDPIKLLERWRFSIIADYEFSKLPGIQAALANRTLQGFAQAKKLGTEVVQSYSARIESANRAALNSHSGMTLTQWYSEVMQPIHDSRQAHGSQELRSGMTTPYGHVVTPEDMSAVTIQTAFDHSMRRIAEKAMGMVAASGSAVRVKVASNLRRSAKSRGPGTMSRRNASDRTKIARDWFSSMSEGSASLDAFLGANNNFARTVLSHVLEADPNYIFFGKGKFRKEYNQLIANAQDLHQSGEMPGNLSELSSWIAERHNSALSEEDTHVSETEVRDEIIKEVSTYMKRIQDDSVEPPNQRAVDMALRENSFTSERGQKIAPGGFYDYGVLNFQGMAGKLNEATVWYLLQHREEAEQMLSALREEQTRLREQLKTQYGGTGPVSLSRQRSAIQKERRTGLAQLTLGEVEESIRRIGKHLNNVEDVLNRRNEFFGNDVADRMTMPVSNVLVGGLLTLNPRATITNLAGGMVMRMMNAARISPYGTLGWTLAPFRVLRSVMIESVNTVMRNMLGKSKKESILTKFAKSNPAMVNGIIDSMLFDHIERLKIDESMHESGIKDDVNMAAELRNVWSSLFTDLNSKDSGFKETASAWLTALPRSLAVIYRKIGPRVFDNLINASVFTDTIKIERDQAKRAIKTFDGRFENDDQFKAAYDSAGNDFNKFALAWRQLGKQLTPYELIGGVNNELFRSLANTDKAALQMRELFRANTDLELVMLRYWWNQKHGNESTPFFKDEERLSLLFQMAQDTNMGTAANNPLYFQGSRTRQKFGLLLNYPMRAVARIADIYSRTSKQRFSVASWPAFVLFVMIAGAVGLIGNDISDDLNKFAFGTTSNKPKFANATSDAERAKIFLAASSQHMGMLGSVYNLLNDTARKNGFQNPILMVNVLQDMAKAGVKMYQTGDIANPAIDLITRYQAPARILLNATGIRAGLQEQRSAIANLTAAAPASMESLQRQPSSGDMRATPLTPVYAAIVNDAQKGNWEAARANFDKAVAFKVAEGMDEKAARQAVQTSLQSRRPEAMVFRKQLTETERQQVYSRLSPEALVEVQKVNQTFNLIKNITGGTGNIGLAQTSVGQTSNRSSTFSKGRKFGGLRSRISTRRPSLRSSMSRKRTGRRRSLRSRLRL